MNTVIVDDKPVNIEIMRSFLKDYCPPVTVIGEALTIAKAYEVIKKENPELVLLDIELGDGTGFDLLKKFRLVNFEVIFTTAYNQYAIEAFRENALDYLLKPIDIDLLQHAIEKAERQVKFKAIMENKAGRDTASDLSGLRISLPVQTGFLFIQAAEILYCEASGSYTYFHMDSGKKILVSMRLKECEAILPENIFFRVHHSYLVNTRHITQYHKGRGGHIVMNNGAGIEVAVSRKDAFLQYIRS